MVSLRGEHEVRLSSLRFRRLHQRLGNPETRAERAFHLVERARGTTVPLRTLLPKDPILNFFTAPSPALGRGDDLVTCSASDQHGEVSL